MPTIKQLLDKTVKEGSSFSLPDRARLVEISVASGTITKYVPPSDGIIRGYCTNGSNITLDTGVYMGFQGSFSGMAVIAPCYKGVQCNILLTGSNPVFIYYPLKGKS